MLVAPSGRELSESEMVIHRLYEITSHFAAGFEHQVHELLELGRDRFEMDIGIVARITGSTYEVLDAVTPPGVELHKGDRFELGDTYCSITVEADGPVGFENAGGSAVARHPAYAMFKLEAYIGMPIYVGGECFGTLNFSSAEPRERRFEAVDIDCLRLMESWLSTELRRRRTEEELKRAREHLEHLVRTDPLTELANRRGVCEALESHCRRLGHQGSALSCVLVDIDDFKRVNDRYGHSVGDQVIRSVAEATKHCLRPSDVAGRIGGDEFLAILPEAELREAAFVAERISQAIQNLVIQTESGPVPVTVSIGVAEAPTDVGSVTDVLVATEALLRESKRSGKNRVSVAVPGAA